MARKPFIAGNWKMNTSAASARALAAGLAAAIGKVQSADLAVFPPFVYLAMVAEVLAGSRIAVGAQDVYFENDGAFTGEISAAMLKDVGCTYVLCGHSERRHVIGETDELINRKLLKAVADGLKPVLCVGELLAERQANETAEVVKRQVRLGLEGVSTGDVENVTIAYEPVWAIGTGEVAAPAQAQEVHAMIRSLLADLYDRSVAQALRIQYGGSVKPDNAAELLGCADVDGALVGGASLKVDSFAGILAGAG
ncbi:MAG TPA: triose-phosphate isomerase [Phycisphaerae bacterium]|nr:triose-phosphate isomerase [Phycisphaerae bacterium]